MKIPLTYDFFRFLYHLNNIKNEFSNNNYKNCLKLSWLLINELNNYFYVWFFSSEALMYAQMSSYKVLSNKI